jgi:fructokinase
LKPVPETLNPAGRPVLCFGEILWDSLPQGLFPGGAPVNVAFHLRQLGLDAVPVTAVGRDFLGDELLRRMKRWGLPADGVTRNEQPTGAVLVELNEAGVPKFNILENVAWDQLELNEAIRALAPQTSAVIYGTLAQRCEPNRKLLGELLELATHHSQHRTGGLQKERETSIITPHPACGHPLPSSDEGRGQGEGSSFDQIARSALRIFDVNLRPPYDMKVVWELAAKAQVIKLNHDELHTLMDGCFGVADFEPAVRAFAGRTGCGTICVTAGARGAGLLLNDRWHWADARPVVVKDTVGSGDSFLASMTRSLLAGNETPQQMLERACRLAEFVATQEGAMPPHPEQFS